MLVVDEAQCLFPIIFEKKIRPTLCKISEKEISEDLYKDMQKALNLKINRLYKENYTLQKNEFFPSRGDKETWLLIRSLKLN